MNKINNFLNNDCIDHEATENGCGYMHPLTETSEQFVEYSSRIHNPVVDLGCAYGVATIAAAKAGASQIIACDIDNKHLQVLKRRASLMDLDSKIITKSGKFPQETAFPRNSIGAVLTSLMLPYLTVEELEIGLEQILSWLVPDGKLFIVTYTVHIKEFANENFQRGYQQRLRNNITWPGYFEDFNLFSNMAEENVIKSSVPLRLHFFDLPPLIKYLEKIGFKIESAKYLDGKLNGAVTETLYDGREMLGIVARKPA